MVKDNKRATRELARLCGHPLDKLESDLKRDFYLTAAEASLYGVVDQVMLPAQVRNRSVSVYARVPLIPSPYISPAHSR